MEFRFRCFVVRHVSDRVTVTPLEHPAMAVHATSLDRAVEELTLALDDRITRSHPRHVADFARPADGERIELRIDALPVWSADGIGTRAMTVTAVVAPAHKPFVEVRAPRLDLRVWLESGRDVAERAAERIRDHVLTLPEARRLSLRRELPETLTDVTVDATPTPLASLRLRELTLDERPPPRPRDDDPDAPDEPEEDDWFEKGSRAARGAKRAKPARPKPATPTLRKVGVPLHELAQLGQLERAYEVDGEIDALVARLSREAPEPVLLVGPAGVGKTARVHEVANRLARSASVLQNERAFFHVDGPRWIAGEGYFGDWQQQTLDAVDEARKAGAVLDLGHVIALIDAGRSAHSDQNVAQLLGPVLAARELCVLGEATPEEWAQLERRNEGFARVWSVVRIDEPTAEHTARILARIAAALTDASTLSIEPAAIASAQALARRFWPYGSVLGNTVAFLQRLAHARSHALASSVTARDAIALFSTESGIPEVLLRDDVPLAPDDVRTFLRARVMGQDAAIDRVVEVVSVIKAGLADLRRPVAVLVFAGPTGVGKTELAKALAAFVFGADDRMVRLDMGEYAGPDALSRLLGEPSAPGHLTAAVRRQPFCVVLLDEIEKAHPAVFDALLGVLGEGRLTDAAGRFTDFRNAVIVMTSNLGADTLRTRVGFGGEAAQDARRHYLAEAQRFFRPELFNRIDDFVVFAPLGPMVLRAIVEREVAHVAPREGLRRHGVTLTVQPEALDLLAARGFDARYGARPLKRAIERELVAPLGDHLASHPMTGRGATRLDVGVRDGALSLRAQTLGSDEDARKTAHVTLHAAAQLRSEVARWARTSLADELRRQVSVFDRASRSAGFWTEHAAAEAESQRASVARALLDEMDAIARQAEAVEDLAFEAYYARSGEHARALGDDIQSATRAFSPLRERLYATMFPPRGATVLYVTAARGATRWARWMRTSYETWAAKHGIKLTAYNALPVTTAKPTARGKDAVDAWRWSTTAPAEGSEPSLATALVLDASPRGRLLAAEHGVHRFHEGGATQIVRVRFTVVRGANAVALESAANVATKMPDQEIRRIAPARQTVRDLRTGRDHPTLETHVELHPLLADWLDWRVFRTEAEPWT